jgi:hypothetical protein
MPFNRFVPENQLIIVPLKMSRHQINHLNFFNMLSIFLEFSSIAWLCDSYLGFFRIFPESELLSPLELDILSP